MNKLLSGARDFISRYKLYALREVLIFMVITLVIHYSFRFWAGRLHFAPISDLIIPAREWLATQVYVQSTWVIEHVLGLHIVKDIPRQLMYFDNNGYVGVNSSCSGFKQFLQFFILFLVYPGPWKHKLWFIPVGLTLVYLTNIMRIVLVAVAVNYEPTYFDVVHDYIVRPLFYLVIFALWVTWVERFYTKRIKPGKAPARKAT